MANYIVVRDSKKGIPTDMVVMFFSPPGKKTSTHITRIEKISGFKFVGMVSSDHQELDRITMNGPISDAALLKRTGLDVTNMGIV